MAWLWVLAGGQAAASRVGAVRAGGGLALSAVAPHAVGGFVLLSEHGREEALSLLFSAQRVFALWGTRPVLGVVLPPSPAGSLFYQISGPSGQPHSATVTPFLCTGIVFAGHRPEFWHQSFTAWLDFLAPFLLHPDRSKQALFLAFGMQNTPVLQPDLLPTPAPLSSPVYALPHTKLDTSMLQPSLLPTPTPISPPVYTLPHTKLNTSML